MRRVKRPAEAMVIVQKVKWCVEGVVSIVPQLKVEVVQASSQSVLDTVAGQPGRSAISCASYGYHTRQ